MLQVYNTLARKKEAFQPLKPGQVSFYQCGPTVYWTQHLGNMRAMVLADLMVRSLDYLGYQVKFVRNYTDVGHLTGDNDQGEDKIAQAAKREAASPTVIAAKYIAVFENDVKELNCLSPWKKPRATAYIKDMAKLVQELIDRGYAYATDLAVYFEVDKFGWEKYSRLSGQNLANNLAAAGKGEIRDPDKKQPYDFALWFFKAGAHRNALQTWPLKFKGLEQKTESGFPGWHLECSAMSRRLLGQTLDIHLGGIEHIPVHHTNEIAQSEAASGQKFVNYWLHNEHLTFDGGKMSKSAGTSYSLAEVKAQGFEPLALRYFFLQAHYRSQQNFTWEALAAAQTALDNLRDKVLSWGRAKGRVDKKSQERFLAALADDFNLPQALAVVWETVKADLQDADKRATILAFDRVLGLSLDKIKIKTVALPAAVKKLAEDREAARQNRDWAQADNLRQAIKNQGFDIEDSAQGYKLKKLSNR